MGCGCGKEIAAVKCRDADSTNGAAVSLLAEHQENAVEVFKSDDDPREDDSTAASVSTRVITSQEAASTTVVPGVPDHAISPECKEIACCFGAINFEDWTHVLCERYEVTRSAFAGRGGFAVVRRGRDREQKRPVAVKFYEGADQVELLQRFKHEVAMLQALCRSNPKDVLLEYDGLQTSRSKSSFVLPDGKTTLAAVENSLSCMPESGTDLYVTLLDFSKNAETGEPGPDTSVNGMCYLVLELGLQTLEQYVKDQREDDEPLTPREVREIFCALARILLGLHAQGLVHVDIKPSNVMRFKRVGQKGMTWKLVDMDGVLEASAS
eukprot:TRINITY_DN10025_c0_g1_i2.p1 TRINITY_DN10025_c0_g1~~TRINITY_DN10025_c0_g1_i2.p1  ORF type:complete len:332 (-),score=38.29 TRINITY_DN10025_c0_g1_i2:115-1086(-)